MNNKKSNSRRRLVLLSVALFTTMALAPTASAYENPCDFWVAIYPDFPHIIIYTDDPRVEIFLDEHPRAESRVEKGCID